MSTGERNLALGELSLEAARYRLALKSLCGRVRKLAEARGCSLQQASFLVLRDRRRLAAIEAGGFITPESMQEATAKLGRLEISPRQRRPKVMAQ